jgi:dipeptidyl-peptidase 4
MPVPSYLHDEPIIHELRRSYPGDEGIIRKVGVYDTTDGLVRFVNLDEPKRRTIISLEWSPVASEVLIEQDSYDVEHRWITVASVEDNYALR